jgi:chromosome partitioning protein
MILLIGGEKGGTGKTTLATNLVVMRAMAKKDVLLIDADHQPSATFWCLLRDENEIEPRIASVQKTGLGLRKDVLSLKDKYEDIIIDVGGRDSPEFRAALLVADVAIIPLRPSQFDSWTIPKINHLVGEVKQVNETLRVLVCISQAPTNSQMREIEDAINYFKDAKLENLELASSIIYERAVFRKAPTNGRSVHELMINKKAEEELTSIYKEAYNER